MFHVRWPVCALSVGLLVLAGCGSLDSLGLSFLGMQSSNGDLVLAGSADAVAQTAQDALGRLGLFAVVNRSGETIYISSKTAKGASFTLVLVEDKSKAARQTRVRVEWLDAKDDTLAVQLFGEMTGRPAKPAAQQ